MNIQYYLIHNGDGYRKEHKFKNFKEVNMDMDKLKWILYPNKYDLTQEMINTYFKNSQEVYNRFNLGVMACNIKHYLAIKDMVDNNYEYGVVMEDNMEIKDDINKCMNTYIEQLNELYPDWNMLFDNDWTTRYIEGPLIEGQKVYLKSNEASQQCGGSSKCACCYLVNLRTAKILVNEMLPYTHPIDHNYDHLFRRLNFKVFWAEPSNIREWEHIQTTTN
jgi:GR25 family glycosyltransferase involved in LPS biosynthesis